MAYAPAAALLDFKGAGRPPMFELPVEVPAGGVPLLGTRYTLVRLLGEGAQGLAYEAIDQSLGRRVVIKVLRDGSNAQVRQRFMSEARAAASVSHPAIVQIFTIELLPAPDGRPYYVMEYVEGKALNQALRDDGPLPVRRTLEFIAQLCNGLQEVHRQGIIHRDIKPANLLVLPDGKMKLLDFGIAKTAVRERQGGTEATVDGTVLGTAAYMPPEQAQALPLTPAADMYAVGCTLFAMLTGRPPFVGDHLLLLAQQVHALPPTLSEVAGGRFFDPQVEDLVRRLLKKNPHERIAGALELKALIDRSLATLSPESEAANASSTISGDEPTLLAPERAAPASRKLEEPEAPSFARPAPAVPDQETAAARALPVRQYEVTRDDEAEASVALANLPEAALPAVASGRRLRVSAGLIVLAATLAVLFAAWRFREPAASPVVSSPTSPSASATNMTGQTTPLPSASTLAVPSSNQGAGPAVQVLPFIASAGVAAPVPALPNNPRHLPGGLKPASVPVSHSASSAPVSQTPKKITQTLDESQL